MSWGLVLRENVLDLPDGSVIRDASGTVYEVDRHMGWDDCIFFSPASDIPNAPADMVEPIRLLEGPAE